MKSNIQASAHPQTAAATKIFPKCKGGGTGELKGLRACVKKLSRDGWHPFSTLTQDIPGSSNHCSSIDLLSIGIKRVKSNIQASAHPQTAAATKIFHHFNTWIYPPSSQWPKTTSVWHDLPKSSLFHGTGCPKNEGVLELLPPADKTQLFSTLTISLSTELIERPL